MRILPCLAIMLLPFAALAEDGPRANTMTVHGEGIVKIAPDQLTLPVTVTEENAALSIAKERHDGKLLKLLKLAADLGIPKEKIQTSDTAVNPVYDYGRNSTRPHLRGYQVQTSLEFRMTEFAKLGDFMNGIIAVGIDNIGSVNYSLQDEEKVKEDALNLAMDHAYEKAVRLAATAKVALERPLVITEGDTEMPPPRMPRPMMAMAADMASQVPPELPAGIMEIRQSVTVTYGLK